MGVFIALSRGREISPLCPQMYSEVYHELKGWSCLLKDWSCLLKDWSYVLVELVYFEY